MPIVGGYIAYGSGGGAGSTSANYLGRGGSGAGDGGTPAGGIPNGNIDGGNGVANHGGGGGGAFGLPVAHPLHHPGLLPLYGSLPEEDGQLVRAESRNINRG